MEGFLRSCASGDLEAVKAGVLSGELDLDYDDPTLGTPLYQAIINHQNKVVHYLLVESPRKADFNAIIFQNLFTPIIAAITSNNYYAFELILTECPNPFQVVNHSTKTGDTPLMFCVKHDQVKMAEQLLENRKIDLSLENSIHHTALMEAVISENVEIMNLIIAHPQSDPGYENAVGESALALANGISFNDSGKSKKKEIIAILEDAAVPHFNTPVGRILKDNHFRQYCERFFDLGVKTVNDIRRLNVDEEWLSWKGRVSKEPHRKSIMRLLGALVFADDERQKRLNAQSQAHVYPMSVLEYVPPSGYMNLKREIVGMPTLYPPAPIVQPAAVPVPKPATKPASKKKQQEIEEDLYDLPSAPTFNPSKTPSRQNKDQSDIPYAKMLSE